MSVLRDKTVVVGVSGGIAAYKAAELVRLLVRGGARVRVMMTRAAPQFITPLTLQTLSGAPVATDVLSLVEEAQIGHIRIADSADAIVIAPASADLLARMALGMADDVVTAVLLAARCPVAVAPAMNVHMYEHPAVRENLARLAARGVIVIEPEEGELACGYEGKGRLPDPRAIVEEVERMLSRHDLAGERVLVSAGPTQEAIDPVRYVSNRSSGKMGFALAAAAWRRGASVRLVSGPSALAAPPGVERIDTVSAGQMLSAVAEGFSWCSILVMAAAVADFRPAQPAAQKLKKSGRAMTLELAAVADELPALAAGKEGRLIVGFAAETRDLEAQALAKLERKRLDLICANDVTVPGAGFAADTNVVTLLDATGRVERLPLLSKEEVADRIFDRVLELKNAQGASAANR